MKAIKAAIDFIRRGRPESEIVFDETCQRDLDWNDAEWANIDIDNLPINHYGSFYRKDGILHYEPLDGLAIYRWVEGHWEEVEVGFP